MKTAKDMHLRRKARVRRQLKLRAGAKPRLSVFRSGRHIYAQVIDDAASHTLAAASSLEADVRGGDKDGTILGDTLLRGRALFPRFPPDAPSSFEA